MTLTYMEQDIAVQLADGPNLITATPPGDGALPITASCEVRESDEALLASPSSAAAIMRLFRVYVETAVFAFLVGGYACTVGDNDGAGNLVNGVNYTVWKRLEEADGLTQLLLQVA